MESGSFEKHFSFCCPFKKQTEEDRQLSDVKEGVPNQWSSSLDQQEPKLFHIKKEEEEIWTSQEGDQLPVKSEDDEKPQLLQLHRTKTEDNREIEPPTCSSSEQIGIDASKENCGGPEPDKNPDPNTDEKVSDSSETDISDDEEDEEKNMSISESESEDSDEDWSATRTRRSGVKSKVGRKTDKKALSCPDCLKQFVNKLSLQKHMISHLDESSFSLVDKKLSRRKKNVASQKGVKALTKPFACADCGKAFRYQYSLNCHLRLHTGEKPFACDKCSKTFSHLPSLKLHMTHHTGEKPFQCELCDRKFSLQGSLKLHMTIHTGEKPFACSSCDRRFRLHGDLKAHMMSHSGVKPFGCGECGVRFSRQGSLNRHVIAHTGSKTFACDKCDRKFFRKHHLERHTLVHSGDQKVDDRHRAFACEDCGNTFLKKKHLLAHKVIHSGKKLFSCDICSLRFARPYSLKRHNKSLHNE